MSVTARVWQGIVGRWWRGEWGRHGREDPYYAVLTDEQYRALNIDADARARFFASGAEEVADTLATLRRVLRPDFTPRRALDFGCGVGRLTLPLARACGEVVGVDISEAMLDEARRNAAAEGVTNAEFVLSDPDLTRVRGPLDFVHAFIVFQHVPPALGFRVLDAMLARLAPDGAGMLHFTYARRASRGRRTVHAMRRALPPVNWAVNVVQGRRPLAPMMPMFAYPLDRVLERLAEAGFTDVYARLTDHGGHLGAMLFFARRAPGSARLTTA